MRYCSLALKCRYVVGWYTINLVLLRPVLVRQLNQYTIIFTDSYANKNTLKILFPLRMIPQFYATSFAAILLIGSKECILSQIAKFMVPTWGPSGADRSQVGPMLAPLILLSGFFPVVSNGDIKWLPICLGAIPLWCQYNAQRATRTSKDIEQLNSQNDTKLTHINWGQPTDICCRYLVKKQP